MNRYSTPVSFFVRIQKAMGHGLLLSAFFACYSFGQTTTQTFTASGTFTVPAGVNKVTVKAWGGGGGGGGVESGGTSNKSGGGGGGGAFVLNNSVTVTPGANVTVTVGTGGTGTVNQNGGTGGSSTFGSAVPVTAPGGQGGIRGIGGGDVTGAGGTGGSGTHDGGTGATAPSATESGGGGGGAGETGAGGSTTSATAGAGGAGGGGAGGAGRTDNGDGSPGNAPGGGGGGGSTQGVDADRAGGAGARGEVIVSFVQPTAAFTRLTPAGALTNASSVVFRVTFSSAINVGTIDAADFVKSGSATGSVTGVSNVTATTVDVTVSSSGNGTINLDFSGSMNIANADGNIVVTTPTTDEEYTIDTTPPAIVLSDDHPDGIVSDADNVVITATFTEANGLAGTPTITIGTVVTAQPMTGGPLVWTYNWDVPAGDEDPANVTVAVNDNAGNPAAAPTGQTSYNIDNTAPTILSVTSNATAVGTLKIGDQIIFTADIQTTEPGLTIAPTTYNGGTLTWSTSNGGDTYTATYTVANGQTDRLSALQLTGVTATDVGGNSSSAVDGSDVVKLIDANNPTAFTTGTVATLTAPVVAGYWNSSNTGLNVSVPIPADVGGQFSLIGGSLQIEGRVGANPFVALGSAATITTTGANQVVAITDAQFEALTGFANGQIAQLRGVITDVAGNVTTGATSATTITIDQSAPTVQTVGSLTTTGGRIISLYWNSTNTGLNVVVPLQNSDVSLDNGSIQLQLKTTSGAFTNISGSGLSTITNGERVAGTKTISVTAGDLEGTPGFAEGLSPGGTGETQFIQIRAIARDVAGNSTNFNQSTTELDVDQTPPNVSFIFYYENSGLGSGDGDHEVILLRLTEAATLTDGTTPLSTNAGSPSPGFYVNGNMDTGDSQYESDGGANAVDANIVNDRIVYLESSGNSSGWGTSTPVVYRQQTSFPGAGNFIRDAAGNELVAFSTNPSVGSTTTLASAASGIAGSPLANSSNNRVVFAFRLTSTAAVNLTSLSIATTANASGLFNNIRLFSNVGADNFGAASNLGLAATITPTSVDFGLPGNTLTVPLSATSRYFYLVADVNDSYPVSNPTIQFSLASSGFTVSSGARTGTTQTGTNYSFTDFSSPSIVSITLPSPNPNTSGSVDFAVTFNEAVAVANNSDFHIFGTATGGLENVSYIVSGNVVTVTVSTISQEGTIGLNVAFPLPLGSIEDLAGNPLLLGLAQPSTYQVYIPQPAADVTAFNINTVTSTSMTLTWNDVPTYPVPAGYLITVERSGATAITPTDNNPVADQTDLINNTTGYLNVAQGTQTATFPSLLSGQTYTFRIYPYTNSGVNINYKTNSPATDTDLTPVGTAGTLTSSPVNFIVSQMASTMASYLPFSTESGTANTSANLFFIIQDDGGSGAIDNAKTLFTQIIIGKGPNSSAFNWNEVIAEAKFSAVNNDFLTEGPFITSTNITANAITFSGLTTGDEQLGEVDDNEARYYQLYVRFKNPMDAGVRAIIDNLRFEFYVDASTAFTYAPGSSIILPAQFATSQLTPTTNNTITVVANQLRFVQQPTDALIGNIITPSVSIEATDAIGNRDKNYTGNVNITSTGILSGIVNPALVSGLATANVVHTTEGAGLTLTGILAPLTSTAASNPFTITSSNESDIILDASFTEPTNINYAALQESPVTAGGAGSIAIARFTIRDGGSDLIDPDGGPTKLDDITFTVTNVQALRRIALIDDLGNVLAEQPATSPITFSNLNGGLGYIVSDNNSRTIRVRVSFKNTPADVTDNTQFQFTITNATTVASSSSRFAAANAGGASSSIAGDENRIEVTATKFVFTTAPTASVFVNVPFSPAPLVMEARDVFDALDIDYNQPVNITNAGVIPMNDLNNSAVTSISKSFAAGILTFESDFRYDIRGNGNGTLTIASVPASISLISSPIAVLTSSSSDIVEETFAYPDNIAYINYQATNIDLTSPGDEIEVAQFRIRDGGGSSDLDATGTELTSIQFTLTNSTFIRRLALYNGTTELGEVAVTGPNVTFGPFSAQANDDSFLTLRLIASFTTAVTDNQQITFTVANAVANPNKSVFATANASGATTTLVNANDNRMEVVATQLHITTPAASPAFASLSSPFAVTVQARDINNNLDLDFTAGSSTITILTNASGATTTPAVVGNQFTNGVYNFPVGFQFVTGSNGDDVTLSMTAGGISTVAYPAPFTPQIILQSSFESLLTLDPGFTPTLDIPYHNYDDPTSINTAANSFALAQFKLSDGNGVTPDSDGAATNIEDLELSITNPDNIRSLAIYLGSTLIQSKDNNPTNFVDNAGVITVTFNGLDSDIIAPDNGSIIFTVRASFFDSDAEVTDNEVIQLRVVNVTQNGGSEFNNIGLAPLIGGITNGAVTNPNVKIEVTATRLDFITQPVDFEGINRTLASTPQVHARDNNGVVDLDHSFVGTLSTPGAGLSTASFSFTNGIVSFTGLQYVSAGDGTITITSNGLSSATGGSVACEHVDVINVFSSYAPTGVISSPNLPGGAVNRIIFGVTFNRPYVVTGEPKLNSFIINFSNPIAGVLTNIRVYESVNTAYDGTDVNITNPAIGGSLTIGASTITVNFGTPRDLSLLTNSQLTYFLQVDVLPTASGSTPKIRPSVVNNDANIDITNGSVNYTQNTLGQEYSFASIFPPTLVSSYPANGQLNVDKNQPTIDLVFSVPVWTLDQRISLYEQSTGQLVQVLAAANGFYAGGNTANLAGTDSNPLKFNLPPLQDDKVYYITISQGDVDNNIGIVDESLNEFQGFTYSGTLYFKTANPNPPKLLNNNSTPVANNPTITGITLTGATINATFDQQGTGYFMVVNQGAPTPTNAQIDGSVIYLGGTVVDRGSFIINQVNPISQFGQITAALNPNTTYDVWMYAANNALPTPIPTSAPYGSIANDFLPGSAGPTLTFTTPATAQPSGPILPIPQISICRNSFQILNLPLQLVEGNPSDFSQVGTQVFNLLLPSGFQFDVTTVNGLPTGAPVYGQLTLTGADFSGTGSITFINNTTLRVSFVNTGSASRDNITISGLRILTNAVTSGNIVRLGGNAIPAIFPDLTPIATISSFDATTIDFTNQYSEIAFPNSSTPITIIPNDQGQVQLIPLPDPGDYGPSSFAGSGVNINQLSVGAVTIDAPFNITLTHTDNNGCTSQNAIQYTVYDSQNAIKGLSTTFCIDNVNFLLGGNAPLETVTLTQTVLFSNLGAHYMDTLKANVPFNVDPNQIINGPEWIALLKTLPAAFDSVPDPNDASRFYRDYYIDGAKILNANSFNSAIPNPYSHFRNTTLQGNTYYDGGSLGKVEFTGQYQNIANQSVYIPLRQNVEFFVPAVPIVEVGLGNRTTTDAGVPIFCENGGPIIIDGFPKASVGSSVGFFSLENNGTIIHARDLTVAVTAQANSGGNFQITLSKPANLIVGNSIQIFGVTGTIPFEATHQITSKINDSVYIINRPFNAATLNAAKVTISLNGFTDNSNGTAELDPTEFNNSYDNLLINYTYKANESPCESTGGLTIRIEPNPVAVFTYGSSITANTPVNTAYCEGVQINFNGSTSSISQGSITSYTWDFTDATNSTGSNPNIVSGALSNAVHTFVQSAPYNPSLVVTSSYGCRSIAETHPINVGIIPDVAYSFLGVSGSISFTNSTVIDPGTVSDGISSLVWDYDDGNTETVTSNFTTAVSNPYANPGPYNVELEVTSLLGCANTLVQKIIVVPQFTPTDLTAYEQNFEADDGGWQPNGLGSTPTWARGITTKAMIKPGANNGLNVWATGLSSSYGSDERSALYSPNFDLSELDRPMISFLSFRHLAAGEGVVVEYSTDNRNVADPTKDWKVLGRLTNSGVITGVNWYNGVGLSSQPGNQTTGLGWTGADTDWRESKHVLDTVLSQPRVVFRFALATLTDAPTLDGFAIDNVRVGNRTRTILVENFKNSGRPASSNELSESDFLKDFKDGAVGTKLVKINYHVGFPETDPFNQDNPGDPSSRALYYGIQSTPVVRLDGNHATGQAAEPFSNWGGAYYDEQTLKLANAVITPTAVVNTDGSISVSVDVQAISIDLPATTVLQVAIVEKNVTSLPTTKQTMVKTGETVFEFELKKLLPSAAGTVFGTVLDAGDSRTFDGFTWTPEPSRLYPDANDLAVVVFIQNEVTKEVFQAEIVDVGNDPPTVTGLEDINADAIEVFPNPANKSFSIQLPAVTEQVISIELIDQVGKTVHNVDLPTGSREQTIEVTNYAAGIYILQLRDQRGALVRKKVMITH